MEGNGEVGGTVEADRIVDVATRLFGELGFDGTSMGLIAEAVGTDVRSLGVLVGGKGELYRAVIRRARAAEYAAVADASAAFAGDRSSLFRLLDAYLDFYAANPHLVSLWLHRGIGDAADSTGVEEDHVRPAFSRFVGALRDMVPDGVDADFVTWTIPWTVFGFLGVGMMRSRPERPFARGSQIGPDDLEDFRAYLHQLMDRLLRPDSPAAAGPVPD